MRGLDRCPSAGPQADHRDGEDAEVLLVDVGDEVVHHRGDITCEGGGRRVDLVQLDVEGEVLGLQFPDGVGGTIRQ